MTQQQPKKKGPNERSFTVQHAGSVPSAIVLASWCPTMDLVAVVTADKQLAVHRLTWQRLWSIPLDMTVTALCWRPDGKVLAAGSEAGGLVLYDLGTCKVLHSAAAIPGLPTASIAQLTWTDGPPPSLNTAYKKMFAYRLLRHLSNPCIKLSSGQAPAPQPVSATDLDLSTTHTQEWPTPPEALSVLVCSDSVGRVALHALGSFHIATLDSPVSLCADKDTAQHNAADEGTVGHTGADKLVQSQVLLSPSLHRMIRIQHTVSDTNTPTPVTGQLVNTADIASVAEPLLRTVVMLQHCNETLQGAKATLSKLGETWKPAHSALAKCIEGLKHNMEEQQGELTLRGADAQDRHVMGELIVMLSTGHLSPATNNWLCATLAEHGVRRLAQQVDSAIQSVFAGLVDTVTPCLEACTFLLCELQGLGDPLLAYIGASEGGGKGGSASCAGLDNEACREAVKEAARTLLQCEAMQASLTRLGTQYRAFFTWLLKIVLELELGNSLSSAQGEQNPGAAAAAATTAAAIASLPVDVPAVLSLLEGPLMEDAIAPDICDGMFFDPDLTPASLTFTPALPVHTVETLFTRLHSTHNMQQHPQAHTKNPSHNGPMSNVSQGGMDTWGGRDQGTSSVQGQPGSGGGDGVGGGGVGGVLWPDRPLRKQMAHLCSLVDGLVKGISRTVSPKLQPVSTMSLLPPVPPQAPTCPRPFVTATFGPPCDPKLDTHTIPTHYLAAPVPHTTLTTLLTAQNTHSHTTTTSNQQGVLCCSYVPTTQSQQEPVWQAVLLVLPVQCELVDLGWYSDAKLALLVRYGTVGDATQYSGVQGGGGAVKQGAAQCSNEGVCRLVVLPRPEMAELSAWDQTTRTMLQACIDHGAVQHVHWPGSPGHMAGATPTVYEETKPRVRALSAPGGPSHGRMSLFVGYQKGVALVLGPGSRVHVFEMEGNECNGESDDEGEKKSDSEGAKKSDDGDDRMKE